MKGIKTRLALLIALGLCIQFTFSSSVLSAANSPIRVKELNFVFLHGMGGTSCSLQLLSDYITERLPAYVLSYKQTNPDVTIRMNTLIRCYEGYVDISTWAKNITYSIDKHFPNKSNLILIGHSMGGKVALYTTAHDIDGLADKVSMVVTINSPIKSLSRYYVPGGGPMLEYCQTGLLGADEGVCSSVAYYDSSLDGKWVSENRHWLAFISAESAPLSQQFDRAGVDAWPRNMDDGIVPLSAQYSEGADVVYYGEYGHSDFAIQHKLAGYMADQILRYIFGGYIECSTFARDGALEHEADWLLGTDQWQDIVGSVVADSGSLLHTNESYTKWQEWEDIVGECLPQSKRCSSRINQLSLPVFTSVKGLRWLNPDNPEDCRLYLRTRAAPRNTVRVGWTIYRCGLLPTVTKRAHYEVEIIDGTPLASIKHVSWATEDTRDLRIQIWSEAQSPFRWFKAEWKAYYIESRQRKVIDEIPTYTLSET